MARSVNLLRRKDLETPGPMDFEARKKEIDMAFKAQKSKVDAMLANKRISASEHRSMIVKASNEFKQAQMNLEKERRAKPKPVPKPESRPFIIRGSESRPSGRVHYRRPI